MTDYDPFAGQQPQTVNVGSSNPEAALSLTIRAGSASDPVLIIKADTPAEVADLLGAVEATGLFALVATATQSLKGHFNVGQALGGTPVQAPGAAQSAYQGQQQGYPQQQPQQGYQAPQQQQAGPPPGVAAPTCPHGTKNYVAAGISKSSGKPYSAFWGCPAQQSDPSKCRPEWAK